MGVGSVYRGGRCDGNNPIVTLPYGVGVETKIFLTLNPRVSTSQTPI